MLHKSDVSNLITGIRPKVKQSVIHLAHHLSRVVKQFENRKGKNAEKFKKKAENLRLETLLLKKIQPDEVSKYALMLDLSQREKLLGDINLPLETKVMIKIATHKAVASYLEDFRKKHPDWQEKLPDVMKTLGIRTQFKKKVEKQQEKSKRKLARKQQLEESTLGDSSVLSNEPKSEGKQKGSGAKPPKKSGVKEKFSEEFSNNSEEESEESEEEEGNGMFMEQNKPKKANGKNNVSHETNSDEADSDGADSDEADSDEADRDEADSVEADSDEGESDEANSDEGDEDDSGEAESDDANSDDADSDEADCDDDDDNSDEDNEGDDSSDEKTPAFKSKKKVNTKPANRKVGSLTSSGSGIAEVRRFADLQKDDNSERKNNSTRIPSPDPMENEPVEEDTFFMTGANRFLKTVSVKRENGEGVFPTFEKNVQDSTDIKELWSTEGKNLPGNRRQRRAKITGRDLSKSKSKRLNSSKDFDSSPHFNKNDRGFNRAENSNSKKGFRNQFDSNDRRKNNDFGDTRNGRAFSDNKFNKKDFGTKNTEETLHPSWEAKRKQKVSLDSFQGKKITFDDGDNKNRGNPVQPRVQPRVQPNVHPTEVNLHPSWEAKRKQKVALDSFQGKKIKFDD